MSASPALSNQAEAIDPSEPAAVPGTPSSEAVKLKKVRELLFGNQVRSNEQQFKALETELVTFKTDFETRLERLEGIVHKGFDSITQQIQAEREAWKAAIANTDQALQERGAEAQQTYSQLDQRIDHETQALKQQLLEASSQLAESLQQQSQDFQQDLNQESQRRQQQARAHKSHLSAVFRELSERLTDD